MLCRNVAVVPQREENSLFFMYLFLHCLPRELTFLLTDTDHKDRRALLADKVDLLWAHYTRQQHDVVAAVDGDFLDEYTLPVAAQLCRRFNTDKSTSSSGCTGPKRCWPHPREVPFSAASTRFLPMGCAGIATTLAISGLGL
jgi:hypothetical protein